MGDHTDGCRVRSCRSTVCWSRRLTVYTLLFWCVESFNGIVRHGRTLQDELQGVVQMCSQQRVRGEIWVYTVPMELSHVTLSFASRTLNSLHVHSHSHTLPI